eukprot:11216423-Lingulodinium_polyedra.AAC.1
MAARAMPMPGAPTLIDVAAKSGRVIPQSHWRAPFAPRKRLSQRGDRIGSVSFVGFNSSSGLRSCGAWVSTYPRWPI